MFVFILSFCSIPLWGRTCSSSMFIFILSFDLYVELKTLKCQCIVMVDLLHNDQVRST